MYSAFRPVSIYEKSGMAIQRFILTCSGPSALWLSVIRQKLTLKMVAENSFETAINIRLVLYATSEKTVLFICTATITWDPFNWIYLSKLCDCPTGRWFSQYWIPVPPTQKSMGNLNLYCVFLHFSFFSTFILPCLNYCFIKSKHTPIKNFVSNFCCSKLKFSSPLLPAVFQNIFLSPIYALL
jgi:hypothetical protein